MYKVGILGSESFLLISLLEQIQVNSQHLIVSICRQFLLHLLSECVNKIGPCKCLPELPARLILMLRGYTVKHGYTVVRDRLLLLLYCSTVLFTLIVSFLQQTTLAASWCMHWIIEQLMSQIFLSGVSGD